MTAAVLDAYGVRALHPDAFLMELLEATPEIFIVAIRTHRTALRNPHRNPDEYLARLAESGLRNTAAHLKAWKDQI